MCCNNHLLLPGRHLSHFEILSYKQVASENIFLFIASQYSFNDINFCKLVLFLKVEMLYCLKEFFGILFYHFVCF